MTTIIDEIIHNTFRYHKQTSVLSSFTDVDELRAAYEAQDCPTHWFDPDTLRFFGSRNMKLAAPGIMIELQTKAPDGVHRYAVTAWVTDPETNQLSPMLMERCETLQMARTLADALHAAWPVTV